MTYTPKPGSIAARAVQLLADGPTQAADLSASLGIKRTNLNGNIATAIKAGLIVGDLCDGRAWFKLGTASPPKIGSALPSTPAPTALTAFMAARWSDGCLDIYPTHEIDGGGFRLDPEQVDRIRALLAGVLE